MRIDRFLSKALLVTRKDARALIQSKAVEVNNILIKNISFHVDELSDDVFVNGEKVVYEQFQYYLLNKPAGYVCANNDNMHNTVFDLVPLFSALNFHTVGRLDKDTTGALILTNNGALTHRLINPKYRIEKTYFVVTDGVIREDLIPLFHNGFMLEEKLQTLPAKLEIITGKKARLTIFEGKYHQVKRMFRHFGLNVISLHREQFGFLRVDDMEIGEFRKLSPEEIENLIKD